MSHMKYVGVLRYITNPGHCASNKHSNLHYMSSYMCNQLMININGMHHKYRFLVIELVILSRIYLRMMSDLNTRLHTIPQWWHLWRLYLCILLLGHNVRHPFPIAANSLIRPIEVMPFNKLVCLSFAYLDFSELCGLCIMWARQVKSIALHTSNGPCTIALYVNMIMGDREVSSSCSTENKE